MRLIILGCCLVSVSACGPGLQPDKPKSTDDILAEELAAAEEQERRSDEMGAPDVGDMTLDSDIKKKWDEKQAKIELKRAARSAATCHGSLPEEEAKEQPRGEAEVSLVFESHGSVKSATISPPFEGTAVGKCALRAMKAVIVPPFHGADHPVTWPIDLSGESEEEEAEE